MPIHFACPVAKGLYGVLAVWCGNWRLNAPRDSRPVAAKGNVSCRYAVHSNRKHSLSNHASSNETSSVRVRLLLAEDSKDLLAAEPTTVPRSAALASLNVESMLTALTMVYENCSIDCSRSSARCTRTTEACPQQTPDPRPQAARTLRHNTRQFHLMYAGTCCQMLQQSAPGNNPGEVGRALSE